MFRLYSFKYIKFYFLKKPNNSEVKKIGKKPKLNW